MKNHTTSCFDSGIAAFTLRSLDMRALWRLCWDLCFSLDHYYVVSAQIDELRKPLNVRYSYRMEKVSQNDFGALVDDIASLNNNDRRYLLARLRFYKDGFRNCYVLRDRNDAVMCMQWIVYPDENEFIHTAYDRFYYLLKHTDVMLENVFVYPRFRGLGVSQIITGELLAKAQAEGYRRAVGYIKKGNITSLNEFTGMGFKIRKIVREYKILGYTRRML
jgi:GNAT superfamily N-acetyltransferase